MNDMLGKSNLECGGADTGFYAAKLLDPARAVFEGVMPESG